MIISDQRKHLLETDAQARTDAIDGKGMFTKAERAFAMGLVVKVAKRSVDLQKKVEAWSARCADNPITGSCYREGARLFGELDRMYSDFPEYIPEGWEEHRETWKFLSEKYHNIVDY